MAGYESYSDQKGWTLGFSCSEDDRAYFRAEFGAVVGAGRKLVELGFGNGGFLAFARQQGAEILGVEIQAGIVDKARAAGFAAFQSLEHLGPEHAGSVDAVVAIDVFEHLGHDTIRATLATVEGLLKPGGVLILRAPNGQSPFGRRTQYGDCTHETVITPKKLEQLCFGRALVVERALNPARIALGKSPWHRLAKRGQFLARDLCNLLISKVYGIGTTALDENIVIWIRKTAAKVSGSGRG
ncbi:MAG: class I SAM-dependent methyltransferase [Rhodospirillaceae bacterium]